MRPGYVLAALSALVALAWIRRETADEATMIDRAEAALRALFPSPVDDLTTSPEGLELIAGFEGLRLTPYRLGDGGWTLGRGRYFPDSGPPPPARIDLATADQWFAEDVADKGERWVRAYVTTLVTQAQFDALVSLAFNLSPRSFRTIAAEVNAGRDPEAAALRYVRAGTNLERGLRRRRAAELAMYRSGSETLA
ncbi:lysozyme [Pseudaquabacterium rugosum]|uniref:Lysozyme n=1 Tax=Pseudaquabacterium rugosum TaxID=2984194 RepID=A0ABU9BE15_9BURK